MKTNKIQAFVTICTVCFLMSIASCSSYIPIQIAVPASMDLGRGSKVSITSGGGFADRVLVKFKDLVNKDGYYTVVPQFQADYNLDLISLCDQYGNPMNGVEYNVRRGSKYGMLLWDNQISVGIVYADPSGEVAKRCYNYIAPHEETLRIYPKAKTEELKMAVEMCRNNQWDEAKKIILEALKKYPDDPENYYMLAIVLVKNTNYDDSDVLLRKAYSMKPDKRYKQAMENNAAMRKNDDAVVRQLSAQ